MGWSEIAGAILQLILLGVKRWLTTDAELRKKLDENKKDLHEAIKTGNTSDINLIIQRIKRL